ncbi:hypothetical protein [Humisphaera borealis]|uniref:Uncharacterized protein n=1 Tax=Humisphaera borealis TaxID=2807512 RepID=A0A7M2WU97_9BACT|nr:hypothetical protein [Humisphaera borealis]QOV88742.1 hypothetical protein IPV69_21310 [Humisphaera borealis]
MALLDKIFGKKEKTLSELSAAELRREEIMITRERDKLFKKIEGLAKEKQHIFQQGAQQKSPELRKALAMQFELKTQEQLQVGRQLNVRSKELLTVSRVRILKENAPKVSGAMGRLNLTEKDVAKISSLIEDDAVTEDMYMERLNEMLDLGAQSDKDALGRQGLTSAGNELMSIWNDMDKGDVEEKQGFEEADKAVRNKQASAEP